MTQKNVSLTVSQLELLKRHHTDGVRNTELAEKIGVHVDKLRRNLKIMGYPLKHPGPPKKSFNEKKLPLVYNIKGKFWDQARKEIDLLIETKYT